MDKKMLAGMGLALVVGSVIGVTALGSAFAGPGDGGASATASTVKVMEATLVSTTDGKIDVSDADLHVVEGAGTLVPSSGSATVKPASGIAIDATLIKGAKMPNVNDPNLHVIQAGSGTLILRANSAVPGAK